MDDLNPLEFLRILHDAVTGSDWRIAAAAVVLFVVWALRALRDRIAFFGTDHGGVILAFSTAFAFGVAHTAIVGEPIDRTTVLTAFQVAGGAIAGWVGAKKVGRWIGPKIKAWVAKIRSRK